MLANLALLHGVMVTGVNFGGSRCLGTRIKRNLGWDLLNRGKGPYERANVPRQSRETKGCLDLLGVKAVDRIGLHNCFHGRFQNQIKKERGI